MKLMKMMDIIGQIQNRKSVTGMRDPIEVFLELFSATGKQFFVDEEYRNKDRKREFYHTYSAFWWPWAQGGPGTGVCSIVFSIDATFAKENRPQYCKLLYCLGIKVEHSFQLVQIISYVFRIVDMYFVCVSYLRHLFRGCGGSAVEC